MFSYQVENWVYHKYYNPDTYDNYDIGLIQVNEDISDYIKPIRLPDIDFDKIGDEVILVGLGLTEVPNRVSKSN